MTLLQTIKALQHIALQQPNVRSVGQGDLYADMASPKMKYDLFYITQNQHQSVEGFDRYNLNLFYISRDLNYEATNALMIQSHGKEVIENILNIFTEQFDSEIYGTTLWQPFTQDHPDLCCGIYCVVMLEIPKEIDCPEYYDEMEEQYNG